MTPSTWPGFAYGQDRDSVHAASGAEEAGGRLPPASITRHALQFECQGIDFAATVGALTLTSDEGQPEVDVAYTAYAMEATGEARPVTFVVNRGPGASSAYLHLGALSPWHLPVEDGTISPSQAIDLEPNSDTWLAFTDLVFVDRWARGVAAWSSQAIGSATATCPSEATSMR